MSRSTYPYDPRDADLRTCRHGTLHRVHVNSLCVFHPQTCLTCCSSVEGRDCAVRVVGDDIVTGTHIGCRCARLPADEIQAEIDSLYGTEEDRR